MVFEKESAGSFTGHTLAPVTANTEITCNTEIHDTSIHRHTDIDPYAYRQGKPVPGITQSNVKIAEQGVNELRQSEGFLMRAQVCPVADVELKTDDFATRADLQQRVRHRHQRA